MGINSHSDSVLKMKVDFHFCSSSFELGFGMRYLFMVALECRSLDRTGFISFFQGSFCLPQEVTC